MSLETEENSKSSTFEQQKNNPKIAIFKVFQGFQSQKAKFKVFQGFLAKNGRFQGFKVFQGFSRLLATLVTYIFILKRFFGVVI